MHLRRLVSAMAVALFMVAGYAVLPASAAQAPPLSCSPNLQPPWDQVLGNSMGYCISFDGTYMKGGVKWHGALSYPNDGYVELIWRDTEYSTGNDRFIAWSDLDQDIQRGEVISTDGVIHWVPGRYCVRFVDMNTWKWWEGHCIWV